MIPAFGCRIIFFNAIWIAHAGMFLIICLDVDVEMVGETSVKD